MGLTESDLAEAHALTAAANSSRSNAEASLQSEVITQRAQQQPQQQPKSYLDEALGLVFKNDSVERNVAEAAKTGAMFFGGRVGLAATLGLYALDQIKVGDSFGGALADAGLGAVKGTALRSVNALASARDFGIAAQAFTLGTGSRLLDTGLDRQTWTDSRTHSLSLEQGKNQLLNTAIDKSAFIADLGAFALGGTMAGAANKLTENSLKSSPLLRTAMTGGVFGLATGATSELNRQRASGEKLDYGEIFRAAGTQAFYSGIASVPAGLQAGHRVKSAFVQSFGVTTSPSLGEYLYSFKADGKVHNLFTTAPTNKGLREAQGRLTEMLQQRQAGMAESFGISFAKPGELVHYLDDDGTTEVVTRAPRLNELVALDETFKRAQPSQLTADGRSGVKFNFLQDKDVKNVDWGAVFEFQGTTPNVFLHNEILQEKRMTEKDTFNSRTSIQSIAIHETAHNSDWKVRAADPELSNQIRENLGWLRYGGKMDNDQNDYGKHLLKGKDGLLYRYQAKGNKWISADEQGNALDKDGNKAAPGNEVMRSNDEMKKLALVPPATDYFPNATEMLVEGTMRFRLGAASRLRLLEQSPILYEQVKLQDDRELALHYGTDASGQPLMMRLANGSLAERNPKNLQDLANLESKAGDFGWLRENIHQL